MTKRELTADELEALPWDPPIEGGEIVSDSIIGKSRWAVLHEVIFRDPGQPVGEAWAIKYQTPATEYQECDRWEGGTTARLMLAKEKVVTVWEAAP